MSLPQLYWGCPGFDGTRTPFIQLPLGRMASSASSMCQYCRRVTAGVGMEFTLDTATSAQPRICGGWGTRLLPRCEASQVYTDIHAELSDITVLTPLTVLRPHCQSPLAGASRCGDALTQLALVIVASECWTRNDLCAHRHACILKPWVPTYWYINEDDGGTRHSQYHW